MPLNPRAEAAIERLAKLTVPNGWDPVQVIANLLRAHGILEKVPPELRQEVLAELRRRLGDGA